MANEYNLALGRVKEKDYSEFGASLSYTVSFSTALATEYQKTNKQTK